MAPPTKPTGTHAKRASDAPRTNKDNDIPRVPPKNVPPISKRAKPPPAKNRKDPQDAEPIDELEDEDSEPIRPPTKRHQGQSARKILDYPKVSTITYIKH